MMVLKPTRRDTAELFAVFAYRVIEELVLLGDVPDKEADTPVELKSNRNPIGRFSA
jgi:hypothetical protein